MISSGEHATYLSLTEVSIMKYNTMRAAFCCVVSFFFCSHALHSFPSELLCGRVDSIHVLGVVAQKVNIAIKREAAKTVESTRLSKLGFHLGAGISGASVVFVLSAKHIPVQ